MYDSKVIQRSYYWDSLVLGLCSTFHLPWFDYLGENFVIFSFSLSVCLSLYIYLYLYYIEWVIQVQDIWDLHHIFWQILQQDYIYVHCLSQHKVFLWTYIIRCIFTFFKSIFKLTEKPLTKFREIKYPSQPKPHPWSSLNIIRCVVKTDEPGERIKMAKLEDPALTSHLSTPKL